MKTNPEKEKKKSTSVPREQLNAQRTPQKKRQRENSNPNTDIDSVRQGNHSTKTKDPGEGTPSKRCNRSIMRPQPTPGPAVEAATEPQITSNVSTEPQPHDGHTTPKAEDTQPKQSMLSVNAKGTHTKSLSRESFLKLFNRNPPKANRKPTNRTLGKANHQQI